MAGPHHIGPVFFHAGGQLGIGCRGRYVPGQNHQIHRRQVPSVPAKAFADETAQAVAPHRQSHLLAGDGKAQAGVSGLITAEQHREVPVGRALAFLEDAVEVRGGQQPATTGEVLPCRRSLSRGDRVDRPKPGSDGQAGAALRPATLENQPPAAGGHSRPESVGANTLQLAGLVGSFHEENPLDKPGQAVRGRRKGKDGPVSCQ